MSPRGVKGTGKPKGGVGPGKETPRWKPSLTEITSWALANGCRCGTWRCSPLVAPAWVLPRHLLDQHHDFSADRRPTAAVRAGPPPADQPPVPAQQRVRGHQAAHPQRPWEQPGQGGEHRPVGPVQPRFRVLALQHRDLLAQHQQLGVLRRRRTCQQRHPPGQPDDTSGRASVPSQARDPASPAAITVDIFAGQLPLPIFGTPQVSHRRVHRLMRAAGLRGRHPRAWQRTTIGGDRPVPAPDLIGRDFTAARPGMKWCGDVTCIKTWDGWAYLATVIDLHSRKVIGWAVAGHMRTSLVIAALDMAITARKPLPGVIFHSDRGCRYASSSFDCYCKEENIRRSLGRTGVCYDNAVSESFFATYNKELIHTRPWPSLAYLEKETSDWIGNYCNPVRRHSTIGYLTPEEYELGYRQLSQLAA